MPFKSRAQARRFFAMEARGELPRGTARRWAHETPGGITSLPERVGMGWYDLGAVVPRQTRAPQVQQETEAAPEPEPTFWENYGGEILVGVITAVASAVATYFAMRAVEK